MLAMARNDPRIVVLRAYARLTRILGRSGRPRRVSQTPLEYVRALETGGIRRSKPAAPLTAEVLAPIHSLTEMFVLARYGQGPVDEATARRALERLAQARAALRRPQQAGST
jgi:hypothetical protein